MTLCSMAMAGGMPEMLSTGGLDILPRNWRAKEERLSAKRRCPSAKRVSKAREVLPEPLTPVMTVRRLRGMSTSMPLR